MTPQTTRRSESNRVIEVLRNMPRVRRRSSGLIGRGEDLFRRRHGAGEEGRHGCWQFAMRWIADVEPRG